MNRRRGLKLLVATINAFVPRANAHVEEVYWDFGADIKWQTIVTNSASGGSYQMLYPYHMEQIDLAKTPEDIAKIASQLLKDQGKLLGYKEM